MKGSHDAHKSMTAERIRILIVEDEPDILAILRIALALDTDMEVETAVTGAAALAAVRREGAGFHALLLNVALPDTSGIDLADSLRIEAGASDAVVVFVTARVARHERARYERVSRATLIVKPFDPLSLAPRIRAFYREDAATRMPRATMVEPGGSGNDLV